ncbi:peroxidase-like [Anopheles bellator]|uniref:peroxidase-like n=1 Tax=Anopheles bellator TaxID=139047 RepID=UPI002649467F|nr:peroxidase-like [Anopheles bellator]
MALVRSIASLRQGSIRSNETSDFYGGATTGGIGTTGGGSSGIGGTTSSGGSGGSTTPSGSGGGSSSSCPKSKYRNIEGRCSSRLVSSWGEAGQPFGRLVSPLYADGISSLATMSNGSPFVSARNISFFVFGIDETPDPTSTILNTYFLQAISNDLAYPVENFSIKCCENGSVVFNCSATTCTVPDGCDPVVIASDDPIYEFFNVQCLDYSRVLTAPQTQPPQAVKQINNATSLLDLSFLYGTTVEQNPSRMMSGGRLLAVRRNGTEWPIFNPSGCTLPQQDICFLVADSRSFVSPMSAMVDLLFFREHNRLALQLALLNPSWSDTTLFEEARRINIAQYQKIVYYEFLPRLLGRSNMVSNRLIYEGTGFTNDYSAFQDPSAIAEFANVVAPYINSQLPGSIDINVTGTIDSLRLSDLYPKLALLESNFAAFFRALATQETRLLDTSFTIEWKNFMFRGDNFVGKDMLALGIQRMRDFGFASYNAYRAQCGLATITTWEAYNATLKEPCFQTINNLQAIYPTVNDIELFVGGAFENPLPGSLLGPTFSCIVQQQFLRARTGDRYFFEAGGQEGSFTVSQLTEIRKISLARLMCSALPTILQIQADPFSPVGPSNPLVSCNDLPSVSLTPWAV